MVTSKYEKYEIRDLFNFLFCNYGLVRFSIYTVLILIA